MSLRDIFLHSQQNLGALGATQSPLFPQQNTSKSQNQELTSLFQKANTLHELGETQKMVDLYDEGLKKHPNCKEIHFNKGYAHWKLNQLPPAMTSFKKAVDIDPEFSNALNNIGLVFLRQNDNENALRYFQKATTGKPVIEDAWLNYATTLTRKGQKREALAVLNSATLKFPNNKQAMLYKGHLHREFNELQNSISAYKKVIEQDTNNRDALLSLAVIYADSDQRADSLEAFRKLLDNNPNDVEVLKLYGYTLHEFKDTDKSIAVFNKVLGLEKDTVETLAAQANNYLDMDDSDSALRLYNRILVIDPNNKEALVLKGSILADLGHDSQIDPLTQNLVKTRKREAIECLDRAIKIDNNNSDAFLLKGLVLKSLGENGPAVDNLTQALNKNKDCSIGYMVRAGLFWRNREPEKAREDLERLNSLMLKASSLNLPGNPLSAQNEAIRKFLANFGASDQNLKAFQKDKTDINKYGIIQTRNYQKALFLQAQNFERKTEQDYSQFDDTMRKISEIDKRNFTLTSSIFQKDIERSLLDQYKTSFYFFSEIVFEHFRSIYFDFEDSSSQDLNKVLSFIDVPSFALNLSQNFEKRVSPSLNSIPDYNQSPIKFIKDHSQITNGKEETRRFLTFFTGKMPSNIDDLAMINFQKLLTIILSQKEHQQRIQNASSNLDVLEFKKLGYPNFVEDKNQTEFFGEVKSDVQILGIVDAIFVRSLMIFYRYKSELQYAKNPLDEISNLLKDKNALLAKGFPFDRVGGALIANPQNSIAHSTGSLERPIVELGDDPDRILNYVEIMKVKFLIHKNYTPFMTNEVILTFNDFPLKPVIYKQGNHSELVLGGFVFPQKRRTRIEMTIVINKAHKRNAVLAFTNLLEDEVWVSTEIIKGKPSKFPKNYVKFLIAKKSD